MSKLTDTLKTKVWPAVKFLLTHKATYTFLGVLLGSIGITHGSDFANALMAFAASLFGSLQ